MAEIPWTWALLRKLTCAAHRVRGVRRFTELVRTRVGRTSRVFVVPDFDGDLSVEVDIGDHIGSAVFWEGCYSASELRVVAEQLRPDDVFFDIGANLGLFSLFAAKRLPAGQVHSFEPSARMFAQLSRNVELNGFSQVHLHQVALSAEPGSASIHIPGRDAASGMFFEGSASLVMDFENDEQDQVVVETLDRVVSQLGLTRVDLLKIDVEGSELDLLRGADHVLREFRPRIIIEVNSVTCAAAGHSCQDLLDYLDQLGYTCQVIETDGSLRPFTAATMAAGLNLNALCIPRP